MRRKDVLFMTAAVVLVLVAVTFGFWTLGSPLRQREVAWDSVRVANLREAAREIRARWKRKDDAEARQLPASLRALVSAPGAQPLSLQDPVTRQFYEYQVREGSAYELCATFERASDEPSKAPAGLPPSFWYHERGRRCFVLDAARDVPY